MVWHILILFEQMTIEETQEIAIKVAVGVVEAALCMLLSPETNSTTAPTRRETMGLIDYDAFSLRSFLLPFWMWKKKKKKIK